MTSSESVVPRALLSLPRPYTAPRDAQEETLASIWAEVLNLDCVGVEDNFSDLGGDSFDVVTVQAAIEGNFGVRVPVSAMIDAPTVAALAKLVERIRP